MIHWRRNIKPHIVAFRPAKHRTRVYGTQKAVRIAESMEYEYWTPHNGLILEHEFLSLVREHGINKALETVASNEMNPRFFLGDLREEFSTGNDRNKAREISEYIDSAFDR